MKRIAFYGGSFDPVHNGHLLIAQRLTALFELDGFVFIPAFHAPHKPDLKPTSAYHRHAMLALASKDEPKISVSQMELDLPQRPYTVETLTRLQESLVDTRIFFVMGADSWMDILTWREWEKVLTMVDIIVVTRPGYEISFDHVTGKVKELIVDLRGGKPPSRDSQLTTRDSHILITDEVKLDVSASELRRAVKNGESGWQANVPPEVAKYIEKYQIYT